MHYILLASVKDLSSCNFLLSLFDVSGFTFPCLSKQDITKLLSLFLSRELLPQERLHCITKIPNPSTSDVIQNKNNWVRFETRPKDRYFKIKTLLAFFPLQMLFLQLSDLVSFSDSRGDDVYKNHCNLTYLYFLDLRIAHSRLLATCQDWQLFGRSLSDILWRGIFHLRRSTRCLFPFLGFSYWWEKYIH